MKRVLLTLFLVLPLVVVVTSVNAQPVNLLQTPGFETEAFTVISRDERAPEILYSAPNGWGGGVVSWAVLPPWRNVHPSGLPHTGARVLEGNRSYHMARDGGTFGAYLYQQVPVIPGSPLNGGASAYIENLSGTAIAQVGIDPTGGINPGSPNVVWSGAGVIGFQWLSLSVQTTATGGVATLFLWATQDLPSVPNGVFWDNAFLFGEPGALPVVPAQVDAAPSAPSGQQFVTTNVSLRIRRDPTINSPRIGGMGPGQSYPLIRQEGQWYAIDYNGQVGFVSALFATVAGGNTGGGAISSLDYTLSYTVRLRSGPSTNADTILRIPFNTTLLATGRTGDSSWLLVNFGGQQGWVSSRFGAHSADINGLPVMG